MGQLMRKRRIYHFCNREFGIQNIRLRRVKVSTFSSLNDPFELLCHNASNETLRRNLQIFKEDVSLKHGIICFSGARTSPVQWAHYSDRHTGVCLGFDVPEDFVMDVVYTNKRLEFVFDAEGFDGNPKSPGMQAFLTKYKHWSYEQEVRMFGSLGKPDPISGLHFQPFNENLELKEVVVGFDSTVSRRELVDCLGDLARSVDCYKVRPAFTSYNMVRNRDGSLWK